MAITSLTHQLVCLALTCVLGLGAADIAPYENSSAYANGVYGKLPVQAFLSDPDIVAPIGHVVTPPHVDVSPSKYMVWSPVAPGVKKHASQILDAQTLSLVYQGPAMESQVMGGTVQTCNNTEYLTFWSGMDDHGHSHGTHYMMNSTYDIVYRINAVATSRADAHEFMLTPNCTAIFTAYESRSYNLSIYNISTGVILDSLFQEVDVATNELLFQWSASHWIDTSSTFVDPRWSGTGHSLEHPWDFFHINSVEKDVHGNYLVSSRHMNAVYYIAGPDDNMPGRVLWTLGGKQNEFEDLSNGQALNFGWQHHARWTSPALDAISIFDNGNAYFAGGKNHNKPTSPTSSGKILYLNAQDKTVSLAHVYNATCDISSTREGSMQILPDTDGNVLIGYGEEPGWTEFSANGTVLHDVHFGPLRGDRESADNYRALKVNWTGAPTWRPRIAAGPSPDVLPLHLNWSAPGFFNDMKDAANDTAYFSWNGATELAKWMLLGSNDTSEPDALHNTWQEMQKKAGFETSVFIGSAAIHVRAVALNAANQVLAASPVLDMRSGRTNDDSLVSTALLQGLATMMNGPSGSQKSRNIHIKTRIAVMGAVLLGIAVLCWKSLLYLRRQMRRRLSSLGRSNTDTTVAYEKLGTKSEDGYSDAEAHVERQHCVSADG